MHGLNEVSYVALQHHFQGIRVYEDSMFPVNFQLKLFCGPNRGCAPTVQQAGHVSAISYQVLLFWIHNIMNDVLFLDPTTDLGRNLYFATDNKIIHTPGRPDDFLITRLLHSKFNAITRGNVNIGTLMFTSSDTDYCERYWTGNEYALPGVDYLGEEAAHSTPWWERPSIDTLDILREDLSDEEFEDLENIADPLADYEKQLQEEEPQDEAEVIEIWQKKSS